jgi:hypothetical protein
MLKFLRLVQLAIFTIIITYSTTALVFAAPKPLQTSADIGNGVGILVFKLIPKGTNKSETWLLQTRRNISHPKRNNKIIQTLHIEDILIDKPNFDIMDVNQTDT